MRFAGVRRKLASLLTLVAFASGSTPGATAAGPSTGGARTARTATPARAAGKHVPLRPLAVAPPGPQLVSESFSESFTPASAWFSAGLACMTAAPSSGTPATSIPPCRTQAPLDANGQGALELTAGGAGQTGMVVFETPLSTANGLQVTFTDDAFNGASPAEAGITSFFSDASQPMPTTIGRVGDSLGYAQGASTPGIPNAYLGIGFDEYGNFSSPTNHVGGPGKVAETIAVRGSASLNYPYIGGYTNAGKAAALPFTFDQPAATSRPANAPTIQETLTPAGILTVAVDRHDGNGFVQYLAQSVVGVAGEPAVPPAVYFGFTGSTSGTGVRHQIQNVSVATLGATFLGDGFSGIATGANQWLVTDGACLTAGTPATPATSVPACGSTAPQDASGQGALQLTGAVTGATAMVLAQTPVTTSSGVAVTFTDYSFGGTSPGADGVALFFSDAAGTMPAGPGAPGHSLGYANNATVTGLASGYLGIGFDEDGDFSNPTEGRSGGPGVIPETIAVRGAASSGYQYLGGAQNASGQAASLPFSFDQPSLSSRPGSASTVQAVLTPAGQLTVAIDHHDGNGFVQYYSQSVVGVGGQPAVPARVYVGLAATTDANESIHQITGFSVASAASAVISPATFTPAQIPGLQEWLDASSAANVTQTSGAVSKWNDLSGHNYPVAQSAASLQPAFVASGINGLGSIAFNGSAYLLGSMSSFSTRLFNESTVFAVTNQATGTQPGSAIWSGAYGTNPQWNLGLANGSANFDFNNAGAGLLAPAATVNGPAIWTAAGSVSNATQLLRKNGTTLSSSTGPGASATGNYFLAIGAEYGSGHVSNQYAGQLGEVVTFNRLLTAAETATVEGYLACKWGLHNRLPANHPYRNACPQGGNPPSLPLPAPSGSALQDPPQLRSANGQLVFNVVASQNATTGNPQFVYNGSSVPPTLRVLPGDTLIVNFTNALPKPPGGAGYLNDANLHYHGLHVSPNSPGDDSIDMLAMPGQSLHYHIAIPAGHPSGLYWYHTHAHGEAERQDLAGMSGALIVDGIAQYAPQVANMAERVLVMRDVLPSGTALPAANKLQVAAMRWAMQHQNGKAAGTSVRGMSMNGMSMNGMSMNVRVRGNSTKSTRNPYVLVDPKYRRVVRPLVTGAHCTGSEAPSKLWTVNGQTMPSIGIRPGERQFWRLVNAGADTYLDVQVDNTTMQILGIDGVPLASVGNTPPTVSDYVVPPASRIEFVVTGPAAGTTAYLRTNCFDSGATGPAMPAQTLATIDAASSITDLARTRSRERTSQAMKLHPRRAHTAAWLRAQAVTGQAQTLTYSDQLTINGSAYDPAAPPSFYAQSGTTALWTIVNASTQVHTFHIHQIHFLVQSVSGGTQSDQNNAGQVMDNVNVPAATANGPSSVTLKMDFTDPTIVGTFLLHCHILSHEDAGMMAQIRVGTAPPLTLSQSQMSFASPAATAQTATVAGGKAPYSVSGCANVANATVNGSTVTVTPAGGGSCMLTIEDATGLVASIAVAVTAAPAVLVVSPKVLSFTSPSASAENASISGGVAPYGVSGCTNVASAAVGGNGLQVSPLAAGSCTLSVVDSASNTASVAVQVNAAASGSSLDNLTFHQNNAREGWYQNETQLTTTSVASSAFGKIGTLQAPSGLPAFGKVYAQPLYVSNETVSGGSAHNLVIVATAADQVYAFDDQSLQVVWHTSFTSPPGVVQQSSSDSGCSDVNPDVGIIGTPVVDRTLDRMYVVAATKESGVFHQRIHALSLKDGTDALAPVEVSGSVALSGGGVATTSAFRNFNRSALLEANGNVYVTLAAHCDYPGANTHGWVLAYSATTLQPSGNIVATTDGASSFYLGSIWMSGFGPAADASGNIYFATGNGPWDGISNFAMSVLKVPGNLDMSKADYFTPAGEAADSAADADLGSGGVILLPDQTGTYPHLLIAGGKCGAGTTKGGTSGCQKYVLNRDHLGGQQSADAGALWKGNIGGGMWGGPAYFQDSAGAGHVIYGGGTPVADYTLGLSPVALTTQSSIGVYCLECRDGGSQPVVSSNGTQAGTAIAWALKTPNASNVGGITLYAFDALNMSHVLYTGAAGTWTVGAGNSYVGGALVSSLVANGRVYVPTDGSVAVFGLTGAAASARRSAATIRRTR